MKPTTAHTGYTMRSIVITSGRGERQRPNVEAIVIDAFRIAHATCRWKPHIVEAGTAQAWHGFETRSPPWEDDRIDNAKACKELRAELREAARTLSIDLTELATHTQWVALTLAAQAPNTMPYWWRMFKYQVVTGNIRHAAGMAAVVIAEIAEENYVSWERWVAITGLLIGLDTEKPGTAHSDRAS